MKRSLVTLCNSRLLCRSTNHISMSVPTMRASVIGVPMSHGQPIDGVDHGPELLRDAGVVSRLEQIGWRVTDAGDAEVCKPDPAHPQLPARLGKARGCYAVGQTMLNISEKVKANCRDRFALTLGGDHAIATGTIAGIIQERPDTGVVWVDAHADINTPAVSPSGNMHGMPLAFLLPGILDHTEVPGFEWMAPLPRLRPRNLVYIGLRDVDAGEVALLKQLDIRCYTMHDIDRLGIGRVMDEAIAYLGSTRPLHLSYDIDSLDPVFAPSTGTRVPGGLTFREGHYVAESLALTNRLHSMDLVEVNPSIAQHAVAADATVQMGLNIICSAMGQHIM